MLDKKSQRTVSTFCKKFSVFEPLNDGVFCTVCSKHFKYNTREGISPFRRHLNTKKHERAASSGIRQQTLPFLSIDQDVRMKFHKDIVGLCTALDFPLSKINNPAFSSFIEKYTGFSVGSESWYRKQILPEYFKEKYEEWISEYVNEQIYLIFDETTDSCGRYILNILIGKCDVDKRECPKLMKTVELSRTTAENISQEIINVLSKIYNGSIKYSNLRLLVTDGAAYALKVGRSLRIIFPHMLHVTCCCHMLHRISEHIRSVSTLSNEIVAKLKHLLVKNKTNQALFRETTQLPLPQFPISIRWGTWLDFSSHIFENYSRYQSFLFELYKDDESNNILSTFNSKSFYSEIEEVSKYKFISDSISKLEAENLSTKQQIEVLNNATQVISNSPFSAKMKKLLEKNPNLDFFIDIDKKLRSEVHQIYRYIPLTSVSAERTFSLMRKIFSERRRSMTVDTLEMLLALYFNK